MAATFIAGLLSFAEAEEKLAPELVREAASVSAGYLADQIEDDGAFCYVLNLDPTVNSDKKYNILRHCGAIYSLAMYYTLQPSDTLLERIERSGNFLKKECLLPLPGRDDLLAIWSRPEINHSQNVLQAKLGGTGLGLIALLSIEKIKPGYTSLDDLRRLGSFLVFMQKEDGSFFSKYIPSQGGLYDKWHSLYYPGEAILALLMLYEKDPSEIWFDTALKGLLYISKTQDGSKDLTVDHWFLLAAGKFFSLKNRTVLPQDYKEIVDHTIAICGLILKQQIKEPTNPLYYGGFSEVGYTTQTAIRLEGLQSALFFLPDKDGSTEEIKNSVEKGIGFLLRSQLKQGRFKGAIPRAISTIPEENEQAINFNRLAKEVRIDYVQHALSAMVQYLERKDR
ncbi:MAG: hypothetical protein JW867_08850 [Candidatus Omnitrophica bacterium]|nr:hypothetical protein [Candidatus Omnitrophota bacterium]